MNTLSVFEIKAVSTLRRVLLTLGTIVFAHTLSIPAHASTIYNFTSFDGPGNNAGGTTVNGVSNNGDLVGFASNDAANPTLLTNFTRNAGGVFSVLNIGGDPLAMANGIDIFPAVVGGSRNAAFLISGGNVTGLPFFNAATLSQTAFGLNDGGLGGLVVGQYLDGNTGNTPGYLLRGGGGGFTSLVPVPNATVTNAQGVNNLGLVTGFYSTDGIHQHGFFYDATTQQYTLPADPNIPNLFLTQFLGINDPGLAVGYYQLPDGSQHGFVYNTSNSSYSFLDDPSAALTGVSITQITGVNNAGEIVGFYVDSRTGQQRGFLATPSVPEPGTARLLLGVVPFLAAARWLRRRSGCK